MRTRILASAALLGIWLLFVIAARASWAAGPPPSDTLLLPADQVYVALIGSLVPLASYAINYFAPWAKEPVKALVQVVVAAVAAGLYQALEVGNLGLNVETLQLVGMAVLSALAAHKLLWLPSGVSTTVGGGRNARER